jgi:hypothetical protein
METYEYTDLTFCVLSSALLIFPYEVNYYITP